MLGLLLVVLALAVGGCVCVVWRPAAAPAGYAFSRLTLGAAELVRHLDKNRNRNRSVSGDD
ncbi:hypothetical protein M3398_04995 [Streptomyces albidoflavus]|nr:MULTISPECIES: hypothetical protein [Streptomyces]MCL6276658.1 hypothetical protein [Streptomyces albidoflavus]MCX4468635.1 hypothetical protein [Streptomyces albidoflavus]WJK70521.1 hypothetical protein QIA47_00350 [Streptomyces albidoflavus]WQG75363.1 hypothetical protein SR864_00585 [Streptomyces albidoflavus]WSD44250.1 hypothetical protein OG919_30975 [Streptomyces albidoflavus]